MIKYLNVLTLFLLFAGASSCAASVSSITLVSGKKSAYQIVISSKASAAEKAAAGILQSYIEKVAGVKIPVTNDLGEMKKFEILVGQSSHVKKAGFSTTQPAAGTITIKTNADQIFLTAGDAEGYAGVAYAFVEKYLGCKLFVNGLPEVPKKDVITIPTISLSEGSPFSYREVFTNPVYNDEYRAWHHLDFFDIPKSKWGMWGHTFFRMVPPAQYFGKHPEYFSLVDNKRINNGQLCLSNKEMQDVAIANLGKMIAENPSAQYWSVSQEDNDLQCLCAACMAVQKKEHSGAATGLNFVNRIAEKFPNKKFVMLAYHYTFFPPATIVPKPNVIISISTINAYRNKPIATAPENAAIREGFVAWRKKTANLMVWDYTTNFNHFLSPYPNFSVMQENLKYFLANGVKMIFVQGNNHPVSEFSELKTYLLAKLLWDPKANVDALTQEFLNGFYGKGGPFIQQYIKEMSASLAASGLKLGLGDNPVDHIKGYLSPKMVAQYEALLTKAEQAVGNNELYSYRLRLLRLNLSFVKVEQQRAAVQNLSRGAFTLAKGVGGSGELDEFMKECREIGVKRLDDGGTTPEQYKAQYLKSKK